MRLRYGVIGAGVVAPLHLEAIAALDDVELVGISSLEAEHLDVRGLLALEPDVVVVCTPHPSHSALTIAALEAGAHVLVEKPLAPEAREADAMIAAADRAGRLLGVCFQQRFRPVIAAARELMTGGRLGELVRTSIVDPLYRPNAYYGTASWRGTWKGEGGGVLMNQAPHTLDLLCHLAGPPVTVWGVSRRRSQPMEAEDTATALLEYANGAVGTLAVSTTEPGVQRIELVGDRGRIEIVGETISLERFEPAALRAPADVPRACSTQPIDRHGERRASRPAAATTSRCTATSPPRSAQAGCRGCRRGTRSGRSSSRTRSFSRRTPAARTAARRPRCLCGVARGSALGNGRGAVTRIAFSNLAAPTWSLERTLDAVGEYGYDGLELRLLDGEPIDPLAVDESAHRALSRRTVPLVSIDTSIELAQPFERELSAVVELALEWGAPTVRVFGGQSQDLDDLARRLEPGARSSRGGGVAVALETHDEFASAARVAELMRRVDSPSFASGVGRPPPVPRRRVAAKTSSGPSGAHSSSCT